MSKRYSIFLCILFCAFIGVFTVAHLALPDREFSENENRYLEQMPKPVFTGPTANFFSGEFMSDFETYVTDQFPLRDAFMTVKAACELAVGKTVNNDVYFGENDTLFAGVANPGEETIDKNLSYVDTLAGKTDIPVYFSLVPNKLNVISDLLSNPPVAQLFAEDKLALSVNYLGSDLWAKAEALSNANWIDMMPIFQSHADEGLFYRTDHHWNSLGAYYGYVALMEGMGITPVPLDEYEKTTVSTEFLGTTYSSSGAGWITPDNIDIYVPEEGVNVTVYPTGKPEEGALYNEEKLSVKDKYSYFMGGNTPLAVIKTEHTDAPKILVVRDSYSDSLAPFLAQDYAEVHLIDLRYYKMSPALYAAQYGIDQALVLYSNANFATDQNLFVMGVS